MANHRSDSEVSAEVDAYFNMLRLELSGRKYNKAMHRRALMGQLNNRSDASVALKHQNISADGGMSRLMVYHNDSGWTYRQELTGK